VKLRHNSWCLQLLIAAAAAAAASMLQVTPGSEDGRVKVKLTTAGTLQDATLTRGTAAAAAAGPSMLQVTPGSEDGWVKVKLRDSSWCLWMLIADC
jgi:cobalamin biosynthesis protein CbiD